MYSHGFIVVHFDIDVQFWRKNGKASFLFGRTDQSDWASVFVNVL